jgi:putative tricarboxylic transport membrane protein
MNMLSQRVWMALPYALLLALAAWFYRLAGAIQYAHQGSNLGPDFWPRMALAAMMAICAVQAARILLLGRLDDPPPIGAELDDEDEASRSNLLLAAGVALTVAYGASVTILGFLLATVLFMALFMYAGRYRAHLTIWLSSLLGSVLLVVLFQKVVYVSLPRGVPPFDRVTDFLLGLF